MGNKLSTPRAVVVATTAAAGTLAAAAIWYLAQQQTTEAGVKEAVAVAAEEMSPMVAAAAAEEISLGLTAAPEGSAAETGAEVEDILSQAYPFALPDWWPTGKCDPKLPAVPLVQALSQLLQAVCTQEFDVDLKSSQFVSDKKQEEGTVSYRYRLSKPWQTAELWPEFTAKGICCPAVH